MFYNHLWCGRPGPRRIQNMGWTGDNELWVSSRGGDVLVSPTPGVSEKFDNVKVPSRGFGILDVGCVKPTALATLDSAQNL